MTSQRRWPWIPVAALLVALFVVAGATGVVFAQESDPRARVSFVEPIIDDDGQLWFKVGFDTPWEDKPPHDLFSFFFLLDVQVDGMVSAIGWQIHNGSEGVFIEGIPPESFQLYILEDGCVLVATGLFPTEPWTATVNAEWGSWVDETTTEAVFGDAEMTVESGTASSGDPFQLVGPEVFDLVTGEMITPPTTTTTTTTTTASSTTTVATDAGGPTDTGETPDGGQGSGFGLSTLLIIFGFLFFAAGLFLFTGGWSRLGSFFPGVAKDCEPERQAYAAADAAYDKAKNASDYWQGEYEHFRSEYNKYKNQLDQRLPEPNRRLGYPEGPDGDAAYADDLAHWQAQEEAAEIAEHNLDGAREAMEEAQANRDEADAALDAARDALEDARIALRDCEGSAPPARSDDAETPSGPPGVATAPPTQPQPECAEGATKIKVERQDQFQVLGGQVRIDVPTSAWTRATDRGNIDAAELAKFDQGDLEDLFADLDNRTETVTTTATIPTRTLTIKCTRVVVCSGGRWVETDEVNRVEESSEGPNITFREKSRDKKLTARMVLQVQAKVAELNANQASAQAYLCD